LIIYAAATGGINNDLSAAEDSGSYNKPPRQFLILRPSEVIHNYSQIG